MALYNKPSPKVIIVDHRYMKYIHGIGNRNLHMDIPCPVAISSYLLTTNAALFISTLSFKFVLVSKCTDNQNFHPCVTTVQQCRPQATNLNSKSHTLANW